MVDPVHDSTHLDQIEQEAFAWVQREADGLTPALSTARDAWLQSDARHREAYQLYKGSWNRFAPLADLVTATVSKLEPTVAPTDLPVLPSRHDWLHLLQRALPYAAVAACLAVSVAVWSRRDRDSAPPVPASAPLPALVAQQILSDGTQVELNRGTDIAVEFSETERYVRLIRGEAFFQVATHPGRPFIVEAGGVQIRAVGTEFNVRLDSTAVNVVVTEGKVQVQGSRIYAEPASQGAPFVGIGQKAVVSLTAAAMPTVVTLAPAQLEAELLWQPKLLDFDDAALREIVAEFNRRNPVRLVIADAATGNRRMTASFRSDNVEGFVRLLESDFGLRGEHIGERDILLKRK